MKDIYKVSIEPMTRSSGTMVEGLESQNGYSCLSLKVLGHSTCKLLSNHLDIPADIVTENGLTPDVFGLAELAGFDSSYVRRLATKSEKTVALLEAWSRKSDGTIGRLLTSLDALGRLDCKTDITPSIARDIKNWLDSDTKEPNHLVLDTPRTHPPKLRLPAPTSNNFQRGEIFSSPVDSVSSPVSPTKSTGGHSDHSDGPLTLDDLDGNQASYVACICCSDEDIEIAHTIIEAYREVTNTVQFFLPQEQLLGGKYEYESLAEVIEDRCDGRLLVVMSKTYGASPACIFSTQFVKSLDPDAKRRKIIPIIKDEDASYPRVLRGINAIKLQRLKYTPPFWKLLSASLEIKFIPKYNQSDTSNSFSSSSSAIANSSSSSCSSNSSSGPSSSMSSYPSSSSSSSSKSNIRSRTFSVESLESIIDNEEVSRIHNIQRPISSNNYSQNLSSSSACQSQTSKSPVTEDFSSFDNTEKVRLRHSNSDQKMAKSSDNSCSSCNPGTVKKSSKKLVTKILKTFKFRSKSSKSLLDEPSNSSNMPTTFRSTSEPVDGIQRTFKSCDDIFGEQRREKSKLHFVQNIVTSIKTGISGSREFTKSGQNLTPGTSCERLSSPVRSSSSLQSSDVVPAVELPLNISMNTFNVIQREYSFEGNSESAIMRSSNSYSDTNTESAILRGAGSTESIDDNNAQFSLC